jgi:hypothetical protein
MSARGVVLLVASAALGLFACGGESATAHSRASANIVLANGAVVIPKRNVGDVDLTALPLGDGHFGITPRRGYVDLCNPNAGGGPPQGGTVPWVHGSTWNLEEKIIVEGDVRWPEARFSARLSDNVRVLSGNALPIDETTGVFPPQQGTPAASVRPDPFSVQAHDLGFRLPAAPKVARSPHCMAGEVGVTIHGVPLFNAVDANLDDAVAEEVQDHCEGHPNQAIFHQHWLSTCLPDTGTGHSPLLGYAFDGFGIYGHRGEGGEVLTNADLDACHGHTHTIRWNGKKVRMYHYHATWEFPYTVGCFRGTPVTNGPAF